MLGASRAPPVIFSGGYAENRGAKTAIMTMRAMPQSPNFPSGLNFEKVPMKRAIASCRCGGIRKIRMTGVCSVDISFTYVATRGSSFW